MHPEMLQAIQHAAEQTLMPDGTTCPALNVAKTIELADRHGVSSKVIELTALEVHILPLRYTRNFQTFAWEDQIRLLKSRITVVGLGGLGGTLVEILARTGVGSMILVDDDVFEDHNLNRQLLCDHASLGKSKAEAALARVTAVNAAVEVTVHKRPFQPHDGLEMVANSDVVVDCLDNITTRFALQTISRQARRPFVSAAVAGLAGHVTTIFPQDKGLELIYGPEEALQNAKGAETRLGCLSSGVTTIAAIESAEVIKLLLGQEQHTLRNKLLVVDLSANSFDLLHLA